MTSKLAAQISLRLTKNLRYVNNSDLVSLTEHLSEVNYKANSQEFRLEKVECDSNQGSQGGGPLSLLPCHQGEHEREEEEAL